jgi:abequosyltransferase
VISLCTPTHRGRAACLDRLLRSIAVQLEDDSHVEVCISDNGSRDATAEVLERHRETFGERLRSRRNEHNLGMAPNMLAAVEMACGQYAWLLGSDDALVPDAIATVLELLGREADLTGISVAFVRRLGEQLEVPTTPVQVEWFSTDRSFTVYETVDRIIDACGATPLAMSATIVRREDWQAVVESDPDLARHAPTVPQVLITSLMWQHAPRWAWCPRPLVLSCAERVYLDERREMGPDKIRGALSGELDHVWARGPRPRQFQVQAADVPLVSARRRRRPRACVPADCQPLGA